jgi:hypothetical protein
MTNVVTLLPMEDPDQPRLGARIRLYSRGLAVVLTALALLLAVAAGGVMLAMLVYRGEGVRIGATGMWLGVGQGPAGYIAFASLPLHHRLIYVLVGIIRTAPGVLILLNLAGLFRLYGQGQVFGRDNALRLRAVGAWLVADAALPLLVHLILSATGYEIDRSWAHLASLQALVIGAMVLIIAEVMKVGRDIEEERSQYV